MIFEELKENIFNKKLGESKRHTGFTLAEVLITLGIIGIVAAMTIPSLVNSYQNTQYVTGLKKAYSQFNQALVSIQADTGCVGDMTCTGFFATGTTYVTLGDELINYFKVVKNCKTTSSGCFSNKVSYYYDGSGTRDSAMDTDSQFYKFVSSDGASYSIRNGYEFQPNCSGGINKRCAIVYIDVNGIKGPNNWGRDIFRFELRNKAPFLYPFGGSADPLNTWKDSSGILQACHPGNRLGYMCAGRILEENWQMNY